MMAVSRRRFVQWVTALCASGVPVAAQTFAPLHNSEGLTLLLSPEISAPTLRVLLPGRPQSDTTITVLFPEHVITRKHGSSVEQRLYLFQPGESDRPPLWHRTAEAIQYEADLTDGIHLLARATLDDDGVLFHYELTNNSAVAFDMVSPVTDSRLSGIFHDVRLERTYVHHADGWDLLASETPDRLTATLNDWLPNRYLAAYTAPVPASRDERRRDRITYYSKSRAVDQPVIATVSLDRKWVVATCARTAPSVWTNPELTSQHADPQTSLAAGATAALETKMLIFPGTLDQALAKVTAQRNSLR
jgi:hypothetical protein